MSLIHDSVQTHKKTDYIALSFLTSRKHTINVGYRFSTSLIINDEELLFPLVVDGDVPPGDFPIPFQYGKCDEHTVCKFMVHKVKHLRFLQMQTIL